MSRADECEPSTDLCTYCDAEATTVDHVPPRALFASPRPSLITVPACSSCNGGASLDDEYFRTVLALDETGFSHPDASAVYPAVLRGLRRPSAPGLRRSIIETLRPVERRTPAGLYAGRAAEFSVDLGRLTSVIRRTTRGLYRHHTGERLPLGCEVMAFAVSGFDDADDSTREAIVTFAQEITSSTPRQSLGRDVFVYHFTQADDNRHASAWVFVAYGARAFLAITRCGVGGMSVEEAGFATALLAG